MAMTRKLWSANALATELQMDRRAVSKCLDGTPPAEEKQIGTCTEQRWYLSDVVSAIFKHTDTPQQEKARLYLLRADVVEFDLSVKRGEFALVEALKFAVGDFAGQGSALLKGCRHGSSAPCRHCVRER